MPFFEKQGIAITLPGNIAGILQEQYNKIRHLDLVTNVSVSRCVPTELYQWTTDGNAQQLSLKQIKAHK